MTIRRRISLVSAASVAIAICVAAVVAYFAVRGELRSQVDDSLLERAGAVGLFTAELDPAETPSSLPLPPPEAPQALGASPLYFQAISPSGEANAPPADILREAGAELPIDAEAREIAASGEGEVLTDADIDGAHVRVLTTGVGEEGAFQIARSLEGTDAVLSRLRIVLFLVVIGGIALAALLARRVADRAIAPISRLSDAAEHIGQTQDLSRRIELAGEDEVGRLAARFNSMLDALARSRAALAASVDAQRQLVADASHELRTPVASLRTDIEVLRSEDDLPEEERQDMLRDVDGRVEELGALVTDVIELARGDEADAPTEDVRLDLLAHEAVERIRSHAPDREFVLDTEPCVVEGRPDRLARALNNLLDNAVKYGPAEEPIELRVEVGALAVRDHGPGVPAVERAHVFDRFRRGASSRDVPGSGLGLAIVRQVAEAHGGSVTVEDAPGGGALFTLRLPATGVGREVSRVDVPVPASSPTGA